MSAARVGTRTRRALGARIALCLFGAATAGPAMSQMLLPGLGANLNIPVTSMRDIPFRTVVRQQFDYSCGSAAVATLLSHHYGIRVGEDEVFRAMYAAGDQAKIQKAGFSLLDMYGYLKSQGFESAGYRATFAQVAALRAPAIAMISLGAYRHFVVIKGVRDGKVLIGDPALGLRTYTKDEFTQAWNGVIFLIRPGRQAQGSFNRADEWTPWARAPLGEPLSTRSLAAFTREMPPMYQITALPPAPLPQ